jgi:hypothetical protein
MIFLLHLSPNATYFFVYEILVLNFLFHLLNKMIHVKYKIHGYDIVANLVDIYNSYFYIKCAKRVFFVHEKVFYAETKVEAV